MSEGPTPLDVAEKPSRRHRATSRTVLVTVIVVLVGLTLGLVGGALAAERRPQQAAARLDLIVVGAPAVLTGSTGPVQVTDRDVTTQVALIMSPAVRQRASDAAGRRLPMVTAAPSQDSNLVAVTVVDTTRDRAAEAVRAYVGTYTALIADTQRDDLEQQQGAVTAQVAAVDASLQRLDQALGASATGTDREQLLSLQSAQRNALVDERRSGVEQQAAVAAAVEQVPLTVDRVGTTPEVTAEGLTRLQLMVLGAALGLAAAVALRYRRHVDLDR